MFFFLRMYQAQQEEKAEEGGAKKEQAQKASVSYQFITSYLVSNIFQNLKF